jgi:hypothetical protein
MKVRAFLTTFLSVVAIVADCDQEKNLRSRLRNSDLAEVLNGFFNPQQAVLPVTISCDY